MTRDLPPHDGRGEPHKGKHILLVDDEPSFRLNAAFYLKKAGFDVCVAASGESALELIRAKHRRGAGLDLVIADIVMPGISGVTLVKELRAGGLLVPVILVTKLFDPDLLDEMREIEHLHYLVKPFQPEDLKDHVLRVVTGESQNKSVC